ncbi:MAG: type II toxin-antitoxin system RelE/ParE family toxin [Thermomicrobia bacterium]|nr:type II toxin-antitoxin system RelE/ParE family toxin [Thermomicrobia bacterium]
MMARIIVRESTREMLIAFVRERRQDDGFQAANLYRGIIDNIYRLRDFPELGQRLSGFSDANLRQLSVSPYCILYEVTDDTVTILDIVAWRSWSLFTSQW